MSDSSAAASDPAPAPRPRKSFGERLSFWIGVSGSLVTVVLTLWNAYTKQQIDMREEELKSLELTLKERSTGVEESKERVDRYKWVLSLFTDLGSNDERKRNFTLSLVRLALTKEEAEQLFAGLQSSSDAGLRVIGEAGTSAIANDTLLRLVGQINAASKQDRVTAVGTLESDYNDSSAAIAKVLELYSPESLRQLSLNGVINGLYYLGRTDPKAWTKAQADSARQAIQSIGARPDIGPQVRQELSRLDQLLKTVPTAQQ